MEKLKLLLLILTFAIFLPKPIHAQTVNGWEELGMHFFQSSQFLSDKKIIVVGSAGQIRLSDDEGETWRANNLNPLVNFQSVSFIDSLHGWIAASTGEILHSSDGGLTWTLYPNNLAQGFGKILMVSPDTIFICGSKGALFRSSNSGKSWDSLKSGTSSFLRSLCFTSSRNGFAVGDSGTILHTTNAGSSWELYPNDTTLKFLSIDFLDSLHGVLCGESGTIRITSDGGVTWNKRVIINQSGVSLSSITYHSLKRITTVWLGGAFFKSDNGGLTWDEIHKPSEVQIPAFLLGGGFRKNKDRGLAVGMPGIILLSQDSGTTWIQSASCPLVSSYIYDMKFFDSTNGYAVGDQDLILWTSNGGETWKSLREADDSHSLHSIYSPSKDTVWVCGDYGWLIKTSDGWKTANYERPPSIPGMTFSNSVSPYDIEMINNDLGYIVGDTLIWKTTDGGFTWTLNIWRGYSIPGILEKVFFPTTKTGFVSGFYSIAQDTSGNKVKDYGILLRTQDEGATWDTLDYGFRNRIHGMFFWNGKEGIIICDSGNVLKTSDGGDSWRRSYQIPDIVPGQSLLSGVNFVTEKVGFISASPGKIFISTDAGESWSLDLDLKITDGTENFSSISTIIFPDSNTVMVSGYQGMLRKKIDLKKLSVKPESVPTDQYAWITLKQNPLTTTLSCNIYWYSTQQDAISLRVYDILGRPMLDLSDKLQQRKTVWGADLTANVSSLPNGLYLLVLNAGSTTKSERFVISK